MSKSSESSRMHCIACRKPIRGKPRMMILQITTSEPRFIEKAKELGFASTNWLSGGSMEGNFHKACFDKAELIWEVAFKTRAVSPRR